MNWTLSPFPKPPVLSSPAISERWYKEIADDRVGLNFRFLSCIKNEIHDSKLLIPEFHITTLLSNS